jgi:hypothetical protein
LVLAKLIAWSEWAAVTAAATCAAGTDTHAGCVAEAEAAAPNPAEPASVRTTAVRTRVADLVTAHRPPEMPTTVSPQVNSLLLK